MNGLICEDHLVDHSLFLSFKLAIQNHFEIQQFKIIQKLQDLEGVNRLFIVDEHFSYHINIWKNLDFIKAVNRKKIHVVVFNFEKIYSSQFPWNQDHQKALLLFENLYQLVSDISDAEILDKKLINKQYISSNLSFKFSNGKQDRILFLGQCNESYPNRAYVLNECQRLGLPLDIGISGRKLTYEEYLSALSAYRYILNPLGTGEFINLRFYETLKLGSVPIQQITPKMEKWYGELEDALVFNDPKDIPNLINHKKEQPSKKYFLEDYFKEIQLNTLV
jgi:hypothetical protein